MSREFEWIWKEEDIEEYLYGRWNHKMDEGIREICGVIAEIVRKTKGALKEGVFLRGFCDTCGRIQDFTATGKKKVAEDGMVWREIRCLACKDTSWMATPPKEGEKR